MANARERVLGVKDLTGYFSALAKEAPGKITAQMVRKRFALLRYTVTDGKR